MKLYGRSLLIGFILMLLFWLSMTVVAGIQFSRAGLDERSSSESVEIAVGPVVIASGVAEGPTRTFGLEVAGYLMAVGVAMAPAGAVALRNRAEGRAGGRPTAPAT